MKDHRKSWISIYLPKPEINTDKRKYIDLIGNEMAKSYIIEGGPGEKRRIELEREMVELETLTIV